MNKCGSKMSIGRQFGVNVMRWAGPSQQNKGFLPPLMNAQHSYNSHLASAAALEATTAPCLPTWEVD